MENIEKLIGKKVREARLRLGLSQSDLAKNAKTSLTTINRLEKGHQFPPSSTLTEIAKALNIEVSSLYAEEASPSMKEPGSDRAQRILDLQTKILSLSDDDLGVVEMTVGGLIELSKSTHNRVRES